MTLKQALAKAVKMFGPKATVQKNRCGFYQAKEGRHPMCSGIGSHPQPCAGGLPVYTIGKVMLGMFNEVKGCGMTWTEAFARAEIAVHRDGCQRCVYRLKCKQFRILTEKAVMLLAKEATKRGVWHSIREA